MMIIRDRKAQELRSAPLQNGKPQTSRGLIRPLLAEILADEGWYDDDPPSWSNALTAEQAKASRRGCMKRLRRLGKAWVDADELASLLDACGPANRCMSGACPECSRALQRWLVANVRKLLDAADRNRAGEPVAVSMVFPDGGADPGKLETLDLVNLRRRLADALNAIGGTHWLVAGLDISFNDDTAKRSGTYWQLQFYGTAVVKDREAFSKGLSTHYLPSRKITRPVQIKASDRSNKAISYGFKTAFVRRVAYWEAAGLKGRRRKCWQTRKVSLRPTEHVELLVWLDKIGMAGRLYFRGARMTKTREGVSLVEIVKRE
jgi:hypothetical protein